MDCLFVYPNSWFLFFFGKKNNDCITFFVAVGHRNNTVEKNIKYFGGCDCTIFKYTKKKLNIGNCQEVYKKTSWSNFLMLVDNYVKKNHKYITIVLDDVKILDYSFSEVKNKVLK